MLTIAEAHRLIADHLGASARATHSVDVGHLMRQLADACGGDPLVWELTGLCHDLDYETTKHDWPRHGLVTADWLHRQLPENALLAIRAHDHRTGVVCDQPICRALKLADALALAADGLGPEASTVLTAPDELFARFPGRPYLPQMILENAAALDVPLPMVATIVRNI